jgi:predicted nucleic acid-binding protein
VSGVFFDTNILLYSTSGDLTKADRVHALLEAGGTISVQVLNEAVAVLRRKNKLGWDAIDVILEGFKAACKVEPVTEETHGLALAIAKRFGFHIYDAAIIAAAKLAGCTTLWSEDMQDEQVIEGVTIRNPF